MGSHIQHCHCRLCHSITITMQLFKSFLLLFSLIFAHSAADIQIQHVEDIETLIDIETVETDTEKENIQDFSETTEDVEIEETDSESMENIEIDEEINYALDEEDTTVEEVKGEEESIEEEIDQTDLTENHETSDEIDFEFEEEEESEPTPEEVVKVIIEDIENEKKVGIFGRIT